MPSPQCRNSHTVARSTRVIPTKRVIPARKQSFRRHALSCEPKCLAALGNTHLPRALRASSATSDHLLQSSRTPPSDARHPGRFSRTNVQYFERCPILPRQMCLYKQRRENVRPRPPSAPAAPPPRPRLTPQPGFPRQPAARGGTIAAPPRRLPSHPRYPRRLHPRTALPVRRPGPTVPAPVQPRRRPLTRRPLTPRPSHPGIAQGVGRRGAPGAPGRPPGPNRIQGPAPPRPRSFRSGAQGDLAVPAKPCPARLIALIKPHSGSKHVSL